MSKPEATKPKTEAELQREREIREERERKAREAREARERELQEALNRKNAEAQRIAAEKQNANTEVSKITTQGANGSYVERDDKGRVTETKNENGEVRGFKYNSKGEVNGYTDENGKLWTSEDGKNWKSEGEKERVMRVQVNPQDGSVGIVESTKKETTMLNVKLDDNKRLQSGTDANGVTRTFGYDKNGNINSFTDESGKQWTSEDGKVFQSENEKRAFVVETNASAGTFSITEPAKLTIRYTDGKQHERTVGGLMLKDKDGKILETRSSDDAKPTTFTFDNNTNKLKTITNPADETFTSEDGSTFTSPSGNTMRNPSITQDGRMTYVAKNGDVMQMKLQDKEPQIIITRDALKVKARNIAYAMNGGIDWGVTSSTIESELKTMDAPAREELKRVWKEMHEAGETNFQFADMNAEFSDEFKGSNLIKFNSMLDRKSEKEDVPANVDMALTAITNCDGDFDKQTNEMRIRTLIGNKNSKQIAEIDEEYKSKHDCVSILTAVQENPNVSQATKDAMVILMKGQDKRTDEDTVTLANLALKSGNMAMLRETMRSSSQNARKILSEDPELVTKINEAFPLLDQDGNASHDPNNKTRVETSNGQIAKDLLLTGRVSTETEIALNTSAGGDNETAIIAALDNMPEADRLSYQRGKDLVANGATVETVSGADLEAIKKYNNIQTAMKNAGWDYETRRWESHINNSKPVAAFIDELYNHRGSMLTYNSSVQDIAKSVENMPKEVWERLRKENLEGRHELKDQILAAFKDYNFNFNNEAKVKELSDILDKKVAAENFEDSKVNGRRDIFTALDNTWGFDNDETSGLEALRHMTPAEQESYKNGKEVKDESTLNAADLEKYRADKEFANKLDAKLLEVFGTGIFDDAEYDAANKILDGVIAGRKGDDVLNDLIIYSQETSVEEADVIRKVQEAFRKNPELAQRIQNPQSQADKAYAEEFKTSMAKALGDKWYNSLMCGALGNDYDLFGKQLVEQGKLDFNRAQMLNVGIFDDDEYGVNKSILYADQKETERLLNDKAYQDKVFCFMSEDQRAVALNNLRERNRQQAEIAKTEQQLSQVADTKEGRLQKVQLDEKLKLQKLQLDQLFAGEMRPEDKLRAAILGCGTDEAAIKEVFAKIRPEQRAQLLKDYAAKYGSLPSDLEGDIGGQDLANAMRNLRPEGTTQDEDLIYALDEYSNSVSGIGTQFIRGYDGTADQMDQRFGDLESEIANANRLGIEVPAEIRQQQMEVLSKSIDNLVESKEALGNTIADIAITVVAIGGVCLGQPESLGLLAFTSFATALGLTGAALKVAIKQVIMGNNYTSEMMYMDMATGFTDGALNVIGPGQVAALTTIGKKTATRSAAKITEKLMEKGILRNVATTAVEETAEKALMSSSKLVNVALEEGASQADKRVLQEVNRIVRTAMTNGSEKLDDAAIKRAALNLVDEQVGKRAYQEALKTGTETVAKQASKDAMDKAADEIAVVMKNTLIDEVKLSQNKLKNYIVDATFNGAGAALAGGTSGTLYAGANFDSSKSLSENLEMMAKAGLMSAAIGGVTGGGMTFLTRGGIDTVSALRNRKKNVPTTSDNVMTNTVRNSDQSSSVNRASILDNQQDTSELVKPSWDVDTLRPDGTKNIYRTSLPEMPNNNFLGESEFVKPLNSVEQTEWMKLSKRRQNKEELLPVDETRWMRLNQRATEEDIELLAMSDNLKTKPSQYEMEYVAADAYKNLEMTSIEGSEKFEFITEAGKAKLPRLTENEKLIEGVDYELRWIPVVKYKAFGIETEIIVPKVYDDMFKELRELRKMAKENPANYQGILDNFKMRNKLLPEYVLHKNSLLPEDIFNASSILPNANRVKRYELYGTTHFGKANVMADANIAGGRMRFFTPTGVSNLDNTFLHEWAHLAELNDDIFSAYENVIKMEPINYPNHEFKADYAGTNSHEDWAVHFGERFLDPQQIEFERLGELSPLRTTLLAEALERELANGTIDPSLRKVLEQRLEYVKKEIVPKAYLRINQTLNLDPRLGGNLTYFGQTLDLLQKIEKINPGLARQLVDPDTLAIAITKMKDKAMSEKAMFLLQSSLNNQPARLEKFLTKLSKNENTKLTASLMKLDCNPTLQDRTVALIESANKRMNNWEQNIEKSIEGLDPATTYMLIGSNIEKIDAAKRMQVLELISSKQTSKLSLASFDKLIENNVPLVGPTNIRLNQTMNSPQHGNVTVLQYDAMSSNVIVKRADLLEPPTGKLDYNFDTTSWRKLEVNGTECYVDSQNILWRIQETNGNRFAAEMTDYKLVDPKALSSTSYQAKVRTAKQVDLYSESLNKQFAEVYQSRLPFFSQKKTKVSAIKLPEKTSSFDAFGKFELTSPTQNAINEAKGSSNCVLCTKSVFDALRNGEFQKVIADLPKDYWQSNPYENLFKKAGMKIETLERMDSAGRKFPHTFETVPPNHYALQFRLKEGEDHLVYMRKFESIGDEEAKIIVYDPQANRIYDAYALQEIASRKIYFRTVELPPDELFKDLPFDKNLAIKPSEINKLANEIELNHRYKIANNLYKDEEIEIDAFYDADTQMLHKMRNCFVTIENEKLEIDVLLNDIRSSVSAIPESEFTEFFEEALRVMKTDRKELNEFIERFKQNKTLRERTAQFFRHKQSNIADEKRKILKTGSEY